MRPCRRAVACVGALAGGGPNICSTVEVATDGSCPRAECSTRLLGLALEALESRVPAPLDRDRYFTAEQAREYGLIDRVITAHELQRRPAGFASDAKEKR
jgi:hypothetical protein